MHWLFGARRLRELGVLGMNRRNAGLILDHNPRAAYPVVDSKLKTHALCRSLGVPTPAVYHVVERHSELRGLLAALEPHTEFVVKPDRGSGGRGVLVSAGRDGAGWKRHNSDHLTADELRQHVSDTLSGMYSLGARPDAAIVQQRVELHPAFNAISYQGIPDVRVILFRGEPAMAMLRLPTKASGGRANLHQGGIGTGVDLHTGRTNHAVQYNRGVEKHPDTGQPLVGWEVPAWEQIVAMSRRMAAAIGLGYLGVDIVVDAKTGPTLLEANARPGLAIQIANRAGLLTALQRIGEKPTPV